MSRIGYETNLQVMLVIESFLHVGDISAHCHDINFEYDRLFGAELMQPFQHCPALVQVDARKEIDAHYSSEKLFHHDLLAVLIGEFYRRDRFADAYHLGQVTPKPVAPEGPATAIDSSDG